MIDCSSELRRLIAEYVDRFRLPVAGPDGGGISGLPEADAVATLRRALETGRPLPGFGGR